MKKIVMCITLFLLYFYVSGNGNIIENQDKPLRGKWDFNLEKVWAVDSAGDDVIVRVGSVRVDDEGKIYILEVTQSKIFVFGPDGPFLYSFGKKGEGPGEMKMVNNFFIMDDHIIIPEMGKFSFFTPKGKFTRAVNTGKMIFPLVFLDTNHFVHTGSLLGRDQQSSDTLKIFDFDTKKDKVVAEIPKEEALTASSGGIRIMLKDSATTPGIVLGLKDKHLYFGKSDKYKIRKTDLEGKEEFSFTLEGRKRKKISMAFKRKRFENVMVNNRRMPEEMIDQMVKGMPDEAPFFNRIMVEKNGLIYVFISDLENETGREIDIFSPQGKYLYHGEIKMPDNYIIRSGLAFQNNYLHLFAEDEEGEGKLLKFKIDMPQN